MDASRQGPGEFAGTSAEDHRGPPVRRTLPLNCQDRAAGLGSSNGLLRFALAKQGINHREHLCKL